MVLSRFSRAPPLPLVSASPNGDIRLLRVWETGSGDRGREGGSEEEVIIIGEGRRGGAGAWQRNGLL